MNFLRFLCLVLVGLKLLDVVETGILSQTRLGISGRLFVRGSRKLEAHTCIIGVWEDLELQYKLKHIIRPFIALGDLHHMKVSLFLQHGGEGGLFPPYRSPLSAPDSSKYRDGIYIEPDELENDVDLELYLDPLGKVDGYGNTTLSQGADQRLKSRKGRIQPKQQFRSLSEVSGLLLSNNVTLGTLEVYSPLVNPPVNIEYITQIAIKDAFIRNSNDELILKERGLQRTIWRAVNDVRTLEAYGRCWSAVSENISKHNDQDIIVVIVGDDAVLEEEVNVTELLKKIEQKDEVITKSCNTARGHKGDQIHFIPSFSLAQAYLTLPYKLFYRKGIFNESISSMGSYLELILNLAQSGIEDRFQVDNILSYPIHSKKIKENKVGRAKKKNGGKAAFVCITGQLMRLEMENKMKHLIGPLIDCGYEVDVALVLAEGKASFQSHKIPKNTSSVPFTDRESVLRWLSNHNISLVSQNITYKAEANMPVNPQYWVQKAPHELTYATFAYYTNQVVANFRMVEGYTRCWHQVKATRKTYSLFIRSRDDMGLSNPLNMSLLHQEMGSKPRIIVTSAFRTNGGINDRLAFVSSDAARCYFNDPYIKFFDGTSLDVAMRNTESYFKRVYWHTECAEIQTTANINPRKMFNGRFLD